MVRRLKLTTAARDVPHDIQPPSGKSETSKGIEQSMARQIAQLPPDQLEIVVNSLREGARPSVIATFFAEQDWTNGVSEKTFRQYISAFRRVYPDAIRGSSGGMDRHVDPRKPDVDEEELMNQLLRVQKLRIGRALDFEERTQLPMKDVHKDIETMRNLIETRAQLRAGPKGKTSKNSPSVLSNEASEALRKNEQASASQDKLTHLTTMLVPLMRAKQNAS